MDAIDLMRVAEKAAQEAGRFARERFGKPHQITTKGFRDLVTDTDIAAQEIITSIVRENFPDHGFLTEEDDHSLPEDGPVIWIIDPIDGTTNFSRNIPVFCVSIAAVRNAQPMGEGDVLTGVIYDPMRDECFRSEIGGTNELNGSAMHVSQINDVEHAQIAYDWDRAGHLRQATLAHVENFSREADTMRSLGSAALALAWIAAERLDGYFNYSVKPWDLAAASLMIRQSGGSISTISGKPLDFSQQGLMDCLASNGKLHKPLAQRMRKGSDKPNANS